MNTPGSWCERPKPQAPSCELPSPWSKPQQPDNWCKSDKPGKDPVVSVVGFLFRAATRR
ncbi:hypothetical protein AB0K18_34875 [Nonomuraea sp. NPDC049421]|uniref:hypothetical protein n=1 Tax=Nonomuraea sp. NPDC049421 TaxID=3155275 RepID=UPI003439A0A1